MTKLFGVPISITSRSQALAMVGEWVREYRKSQLKSAKIGFNQIADTSDKSEPDLSGLSIIRSGPPPAGQADPAETPTFPKIVVTPNPEIIVAAQSDPEFLKALQGADLSIPDGIGIVWAVNLLKNMKQGLGMEAGKSRPQSSIQSSLQSSIQTQTQLPVSRISGLDLMEGTILQGYSFKDHPLKVLLLGGRPGIAQKAAEKFRHLERPGLSRKGQAFIQSISGPKDITLASKKEIDDLISSVNRFQPDLLFVAFGHGKQEKWLMANRDRLTAGVAMAVGGAFDQIADPSLRPPLYINSIGLGWLYRLIRQPWRWRRQLALVKFMGMVLQERLKS